MMKSTSSTQVIKNLDEFARILNEILKGMEDDKIVIEIERTKNLVVSSRKLKKKFILENWSCLGYFNPCSRRLYYSLDHFLGHDVLIKIFNEFEEWLRKKYPVSAKMQGLVVYPFSVKIIIEDEIVEYRALMGKDIFKTKVIIRREL